MLHNLTDTGTMKQVFAVQQHNRVPTPEVVLANCARVSVAQYLHRLGHFAVAGFDPGWVEGASEVLVSGRAAVRSDAVHKRHSAGFPDLGEIGSGHAKLRAQETPHWRGEEDVFVVAFKVVDFGLA